MKVAYSYLLDQFNLNSKDIKVKYIDLPRQAHAEDMLNDIRELLLKTGQFTLGPQVEEFERGFARLCQTKYAVGVNSGTDALFLSLIALGIGPGDEVITAPNSFLATTGAVVNTGAKPVFVDVADDYNLDPSLIEAAITPRTKAILPVHLTGNPADMPRIIDIANKLRLYVIEDAAQAIGANIDGKSVGSFGTTGGFSMHPLKNLNVWGDGGAITTNSPEIRDKLILLRNHGLQNRDECTIFAYNSRLDTLQSIVALRLMKDLDDITNTRIKHAMIYDQALAGLKDFVTIPPRKKNIKQVFHTYVIQAKRRNDLYKYLLENGIEVKVHYPIPLHLQEAARFLGYKEGDFPVCEAQAKSILTLPVHQHLAEEQLIFVVDTIKKFYKK
jgi:dTDP-3-amino-2,3,6-trideoxy-4-keto-D-glucose/dTDP-3-amino-3,4,6-trideoxy-alpha-D-glucose/dTDP-2,6-dideoxy-D-kanosamine transaminase